MQKFSTPCRFFLQGRCTREDCRFSHDEMPLSKKFSNAYLEEPYLHDKRFNSSSPAPTQYSSSQSRIVEPQPCRQSPTVPKPSPRGRKHIKRHSSQKPRQYSRSPKQRDGHFKLVVDNKLAVVVSSGFGSGMSSWIPDKELSRLCATDGRIASEVLDGKTDILDFVKGLGYDVFKASNLSVVWVPLGSLWRVTEYDGDEGVEIFDPSSWNRA